MGFNPLKVISAALKAAGSVFGIDVGGIVDAIDGDKLTPEQRQQLLTAEIELKKLAIAEHRDIVDLLKTEIASEDRFVRRARPWGLYVAYSITGLLALAQTVLVLHAAFADRPLVTIDVAAVVALLTPLYGHVYYYTKKRSEDKKNGAY